MRRIKLLLLGLAVFAAGSEAVAQERERVTITGFHTSNAYLGIQYKEEREVSDGHTSGTVTIAAVSKDSPAEKAGLRAGDEIVRINGLTAANGKFAAVARTLTEGDTVKLRIKRDSKEREYTVVAVKRPASYATISGRNVVISTDSIRGLMKVYMDTLRLHLDSLKLPRIWMEAGDSTFGVHIQRFGKLLPPDSVFFHTGAREELSRHFEGELGPGVVFRSMEMGIRSIAGAEFTPLDPAMNEYFGTDRGLLVLRVADETPAARAGLQAGDVVMRANGRPISTVHELRALLHGGEAIKLDVMRKGQARTIELGGPRTRSE